MKSRWRVVLVMASVVAPVWGANKAMSPAQSPAVNISTGPISAGQYVSPGAYVATIAPTLNMEMAGRLKKALEAIPGLESTDASSTDSTVHFTVKEGAKIRVADIQAIIAKTDAGAVMTTPMLAHSDNPKPGL